MPVEQQVWEKALQYLQGSMDDETFSTWIRPTQLHDISDTSVTLSVPSTFYKNWLASNYRDLIVTALREVTEHDYSLDFLVEARPEAEVQPFPSSDPTQAKPSLDLPKSSYLNPKYIFDRFVVGESNRFAHAACRQVADPNSKPFNPLFLYGGVGLGKTHLMNAMGHQLKQSNPNARILYVSSEQFMNSFIESISQGRQVDFRDHYRQLDLLMIDDVQFFSGKEQTQIEFFHTFNALHDAGKRIVITSDRPPKELTALEDRLRNRFSWGLVVDVMPPDLETRIAILKKKADEEHIDLPSDVTLYIAERVQSNIRELEGILVRLRAYATLHTQPISLQLAKDILGHLLDGDANRPTDIEDIIEVVCTYFEIKRADLLGSSRLKKYSSPRHIAQFLSRKLTTLSYPDIAQKFGGRDHSSILHGVKKVEESMNTDENLRNLVSYLTRKVKGAS